MTALNVNAQRRNFTSFVNKTFLFMALWVAVGIVGLQFYIFEVETKNSQVTQEISLTKEALNELDSLLLDYALDNSSLSPQKITDLQEAIQSHISNLSRLNIKIETEETAALPAFNSVSMGEYREAARLLREQFQKSESLADLKTGVNLEQLKRFLIGFGVFTTVFILLLMSSIRKRIKENGRAKEAASSQDHTQDFLASEDEWDVNESFYNKVFLYSCFQRMLEPCLILNDKREVRYSNQAFSAIWNEDKTALASMLGLQEGTYDELKKLVIPQPDESELDKKVHVGEVTFSYTDTPIWDGSSIIGYECKLLLESDKLEYEALSKSVALMVQDVWDAPVRVLRQDSPVAYLAEQLEIIRTNTLALFEKINALSEASSLVQTRKLQHVLTLFQDIKKGEFDFDFNPNDILKLSEKLSLVLEGAVEEDVSEINAFVEDLHAHCERIIHSDEDDENKHEAVLSFLAVMEESLLDFVESVGQKAPTDQQKIHSRVATLEDALQRLHDAKEVTLNAMNEGSYEDDDIDFKQFFIDDVDGQMTAAISMIDKAFTIEKAALEADEPKALDVDAKLKEIHQHCSQFVSRKTGSDELIDQVRFLAKELSGLDEKVQKVVESRKKNDNDAKDLMGEEENGDW